MNKNNPVSVSKTVQNGRRDVSYRKQKNNTRAYIVLYYVHAYSKNDIICCTHLCIGTYTRVGSREVYLYATNLALM